jgi:hypothetical protein
MNFFREHEDERKVPLRRFDDEDEILSLLCRTSSANILLKCIFKYFIYYTYFTFHTVCINLLICNVYYCHKTYNMNGYSCHLKIISFSFPLTIYPTKQLN